MLKVLTPDDPGCAPIGSRSPTCALTVMAKAPRPGRVKTRLSPPLTPEQASQLNVCFLRDTAENIAAVCQLISATGTPASGLISYTPVGDEHLFEGLLPPGFALVPQRGDGFGERLLAAARDILACGYASVCLIDSDSPTVPASAYQRAVAELGRPGDRIVLGPAADGGYYLIGLKKAHAAIFENIPWSTDRVAEATRNQAQSAGLELIELPTWYDVDDASTLSVVKAELLAGMAPGFATHPGYRAPHTRQFLTAHGIDPLPAPASTPPGSARNEESWEDAS